MTTVVVTGGAGFLGSHLCDLLLARGHRVVAVDDLSSGRLANLGEARSSGPRFTFYSLDVRAPGLAEVLARHRPEVVVHLAARTEPSPHPLQEAQVGVTGLLSVLEASVSAGARLVVFASSAGVYGRQRTLPVRERALWGARPLGPAAISKRAAEHYLRFYRADRGIEFASVVLPTVYGPRQRPEGGVVAALAEAMLAGNRPVVHGDGQQTRDLLFVDDAVHALSLAIERGAGRTVNVGTGTETAVLELVDLLASITGFRGRPLHTDPRPDELGRMALDAGLAARVLGWRPWTHLEDGLRETVAYLRGG